MRTGSYGLMPEDGPPPPAGPGGYQGRAGTWPVWSGPLPPLADGFTLRPDTVPGLEAALVPGTAVALVPGPAAAQPPGPPAAPPPGPPAAPPPGPPAAPPPGPPVGQPPAAGSRHWRESTGKTQLARYHAESLWRSQRLAVLAWVTASSRASVLAGYVQAATALGASTAGDAEAVAAKFVGWLGQTDRPWLVVLDDVRDAADMRGLWPAGPAGLLLITTADAATVPGEFRPLTVPVPAFSSREAMSYLSGRLSTDPDQRSGAIDLVGDLGGEPIALAQASAVIASSGMSCRDYRQYFLQRQARLAEAGRPEPPAGAVTWTFSAEYAEHLSPGVSIRSLVALAALLDGHGIPGAVFTTRASVEYLMGDGGAQPPDPQRAWGAILNLRRAGLLAVDPPAGPPSAVRISPVIQAAIRTAIPAELLDRAVRAAADALVETWPRDDARSQLAAELRSCAVRLTQAGTGTLWADDRCHPLLLLAGQSMDDARLTGPAVTYWRELAADADQALGPGHLETLAVLGHLGDALLAAGQTAEAASCLQRVLDGRAGALGPDHPGTIAAKVSLGHALVAVGRPGDALDVLAEAIAGSEIIRAADHVETLAAREEYAAACRAAGRPAEAIRAYRQALADRERIQGPRHPDTMTASLGLAGAYLAAGQPKDAVSQYKRVLSDREAVLGADHPDTLLARSSLAAAYFAAGRMGSVLQLYEAASAGYARTLGPDHPTTLTCQAELARAYYVTGRLGDATTLLTDAIARSEQALPPGDPLTRAMRESLANITG